MSKRCLDCDHLAHYCLEKGDLIIPDTDCQDCELCSQTERDTGGEC